MLHLRFALAGMVLLSVGVAGHAGLHYSGEKFAELPSQWRGFLLDQRMLRQVAVKPNATMPPSPARERYQEEAGRLEKVAKERPLTADESADLGAVYLRLGEVGKSVELLRAAQRQHPDHFRIAANLGTAWQMQGDLDQAIACLEQAVRLAPEKLKKAEEYHLKLLRFRRRQPANTQNLDDLFGVRYVNDAGKYEPGKIAAAERKKLPEDAVAVVQQMGLWLPADGLILWQLAEVANAHGDVRTAAAIMDGCVTEFGLSAPELREKRQQTRAAADEQAKNAPVGADAAKAGHEAHVGGMKPRSKRPLVSRLDLPHLPPIQANGVNPLPWAVLGETSLDRKFRPTFAKYLQDLDDKQVTLVGHMQPFGEAMEVASFMFVEYPIGCWFCETPEPTGILLVELPEGQSTNFTRGRVKIEGKLKLNATDPENFLYTISKAKVTEEK